MRAASVVFLAFDLGAESGRAIAGELEEGQLKLVEVHRFPNGPVRVGDHLYWDALYLWREVKTGLARAAQTYGRRLISVGVDTWGVDYGLLDAKGELVGNPYHYRDSRTEGMMEAVFQRVPREQIFEQTGIQFMRLNTLFQLFSSVVSGTPQLQIAKSLLFMPDLFHYWLTGVKIAEFTIATTSQLYNPRKGDWATELLDALGIPTHLLVPLCPPVSLLGGLLPSVAEEVGAREVQVVAPACHDTACAVAAVPMSGPNAAYLSSGTWSLLGMEVSEPVITEVALRSNFTNEGGVFGTYRLLKNVMGLWLLQECRRAWSREGHEEPYERLSAKAQAAEPFRSLIDPDDETFLAPKHMPSAIRAFCARTSQPLPETEGQFVRCILESLALKYRWVIEKLQELTGQPIEVLHIVGGGSQNRLLNQWTADAMGKAVIAGPVEATAIGNVLLQAVALGYLGTHADLRAVSRRSFPLETFEPHPDPRWEEAYDRFLSYAGAEVG